MKYTDEDGEAISGFYDLNEEMKTGVKEKICMNPSCKELDVLVKHKCPVRRPLIRLGKKCWNCKEDKYLEDHV